MVQNKFFASFLILLLTFGFQYSAKTLFGWSPDFVLGTLVTFSFFLGFIEMVCMGVISALFLNWQPQFSPEIVMLIALPLLVFEIKKYFLWRVEINHIFSIFFTLVLFYSVLNYGSLFSNPALFLKSAGWTLVFSAFVFQIFNYLYRTKEM